MSVMSARFWLFLAISFVGAVDVTVAQIGGLGRRALLDRYNLERAWANQATIDVLSDVVNYLIADEDVVIVQTRSGMLTVFDSETGHKLWDGQLAVPDQMSFPAVTNAETMFVVIGSNLYARNKFTGKRIWTLRLPDPPSTSPAVDEKRVYIGMITGAMYAYNLDRLEYLQERGLLPTWRYDARAWRVSTSAPVIGPPVTNGEVAAFTNGQGVLYVYEADTSKLIFAFETSEPATAPITLGTGREDGVVQSYLYFVSGNNTFYCLRVANGTTRWQYVSGAPIRIQPTTIGDDIFVTPLESGLYNLDPTNGAVTWWSPVARKFVAASPTRVYGMDGAGNLTILDRASGGLIGTIPMRDYEIQVRNERTDRIFMATTTGRVACFKEKNIDQPLYLAFPQRRPILPIFPGDEVIKAPKIDGATETEKAAPAEGAVPEQAVEGEPAA